MSLDHSIESIRQLSAILAKHGARDALIKELKKNHNDKNQVYSGKDFQPLHPFFSLHFAERTECTSFKSSGGHAGKPILEGTFSDFVWVRTDNEEVQAKNAKLIIYPQYPEARLSGFKTVRNTTPRSITIEYTKAHPDARRYLVLGRRGSGSVVAIMVAEPGHEFVERLKELECAPGSRVWKYLSVAVDSTAKLHQLLMGIVGKEYPGCRYDAKGNVIPFTGTQVCGYTLEYAPGILPDSSMHGDFEGIELKAHTQKKVTLMTPEPDRGLYAEDFPRFMKQYGYKDNNGNYRLTGIHRVGKSSGKSGLTLKILNYDPSKNVASQAANDIPVALEDGQGSVAAGWSLERLLNCRGAKHNEVVYVKAEKHECKDLDKAAEGYKYTVVFDDKVIWCKHTSPDNLLRALSDGTIFLDPAPKLDLGNPGKSKRRAQWRANNIDGAVQSLYEEVEIIALES